MKTKRKTVSSDRTAKQRPVSSSKGRTVNKQLPASSSKGRAVKQQLPASSLKRRTVKEPAPLATTEEGQGQKLPPKIKSADPTHDSTPEIIDSKLERMAGTPNPTRVPGGGRFHS